MNIGLMKICYFALAGAGLAFCLYYGEYASAMMIAFSGFMVAQA